MPSSLHGRAVPAPQSLCWRKSESTFIMAKNLPATDEASTIPPIKRLRTIYRTARAGYEAGQATKPVSGRLYEAYLGELNKLAATVNDPSRVQARARSIAAIGG